MMPSGTNKISLYLQQSHFGLYFDFDYIRSDSLQGLISMWLLAPLPSQTSATLWLSPDAFTQAALTYPGLYGFNSAQCCFCADIKHVLCPFWLHRDFFFPLCQRKRGQEKGVVGDKGEDVFTNSWMPPWFCRLFLTCTLILLIFCQKYVAFWKLICLYRSKHLSVKTPLCGAGRSVPFEMVASRSCTTCNLLNEGQGM